MQTEKILLKTDHTFAKCPNCGAVGKLRRSKTKNSVERSWKLGFWGYYRCRECDWRGKKLSISMRRITYKTIILYLFLMLATAVIVRLVIQKFAMN